MRHDHRGSWYLLTGAVLGAAMGLFYSWMISPVRYVNAPPYALRADYKDEYRVLVASAYLYSDDLVRAEKRLAELRDENTAQSLAKQAQQALAAGSSEEEVKALGLLAMALSKGVTPPPVQLTPTKESVTSTPNAGTSTPVMVEPTATQAAPVSESATPGGSVTTPEPTGAVMPVTAPISSPTQGAAFILNETRLVCNPDQPEPLIQVELRDVADQPVPYIEVVVTWNEGEDHFFTGLKPELGAGYGDFVMTPGVVYSLHLAIGGQPANDLAAAECLSEDETRYWGSWMLTFIQP